ncbi:Lipin/Ned1/Smp2-domain-containing protein [Globomyces pollinis-pini]|nr:Lipin/Ned1/Smp2-domain-containing protein [Globomyces pollinis-pini]
MTSLVTDLAGRALWPVVSAVNAVGSFYGEINPATLSGAIDIVVVKQPNGDLMASPFHVRFGKLKLLRPSDKIVELSVNNNPVDIVMKVGDQGEAFFVVEADNPASEYATSPILHPSLTPTDDNALSQFQLNPQLPESNDKASTALSTMNSDFAQMQLNNTNLDSDFSNIPTSARIQRDFLAPLINNNNNTGLAQDNNSLGVELGSGLGSTVIENVYSNNELDNQKSGTIKTNAVTADNESTHTLSIHKTDIQNALHDAPTSQLNTILSSQTTKIQPSLLLDGVDSNNQDKTTKPTDITLMNQMHTNDIPPINPMDNPDYFDASLATLDLHTKLPPNSPPWSWSWGGLPERQSQNVNQKAPNLGKRVSTPALSYHAKPTISVVTGADQPLIQGSISPDEKVNKYLSTLQPNANRIAIDQELNPDICQEILGNGLREETEILVSQCGPLSDLQKLSPKDADDRFEAQQIDFETFCDRPDILYKSTTIYKINGYLHTWETACPIILSQILFRRSLSTQGLMDILSTPKSTSWSWWGSRSTSPTRTLRPKASEPNFHTPPPATPLVSPKRAMSPAARRPGYAKSLRMNSTQLKALNLKKGVNTIQFSVNSGFQGKAISSAKIYLWDHDTKIVISDVDGTITKSDVLGHVFTMVDNPTDCVANFYTNIANNGYHFLYLTSRAIGQAGYTREYLAKVEQDQYQLPEGPILLSPDRLMQAFTREVIQRKPQEFKMQCLRDIGRLFGETNPFYAGFGNRITDAMSYRSVNVPSSRIFTIDPSGDIKLELLADYKSTYTKLNETVDQLFPPTTVLEPEYNDFSYWKPALPPVVIDVESDDESESSGSSDEIDPLGRVVFQP